MSEIEYELRYELLSSEPPESTPKKTRAFKDFRFLATTAIMGKSRVASDIGHNAIRKLIRIRRNHNTQVKE